MALDTPRRGQSRGQEQPKIEIKLQELKDDLAAVLGPDRATLFLPHLLRHFKTWRRHADMRSWLRQWDKDRDRIEEDFGRFEASFLGLEDEARDSLYEMGRSIADIRQMFDHLERGRGPRSTGGRPSDLARRSLAQHVAESLSDLGVRLTKSHSYQGTLAAVLQIAMNAVGEFAPNDPYDLTARAMSDARRRSSLRRKTPTKSA